MSANIDREKEIEITSQMVEAGYQVLAQSGIQDCLLEADKDTVEEMFRKMCLLAGLQVKASTSERYKT